MIEYEIIFIQGILNDLNESNFSTVIDIEEEFWFLYPEERKISNDIYILYVINKLKKVVILK